MKEKLKQVPDFDDLLFENRNREYGAYQLRKRYNSVVLVSIAVASVLFSAAVILPFLIRPSDEHVMSGGSRFVMVQMENLEPPQKEIYVPPAPPPPRPKIIREAVKYTAPQIVDTLVPVKDAPASADELLAHADDIDTDDVKTGFGDELMANNGGDGSDAPFFLVEVMPTFRGGDVNKFCEWVKRRTNYPQAAIDAKIQGTVFITFIVEKDGSVSNVAILKGVHPLLDNEAVKAISESPRWSPGLQRGQPVRVRYQIPLNFSL